VPFREAQRPAARGRLDGGLGRCAGGRGRIMGKPGVGIKAAALVAVAAPWCRSGKPSGQRPQGPP
jgi:hypothetical protein